MSRLLGACILGLKVSPFSAATTRVVRRCLGPFLVETCALVEAGVDLEKLDKVMKSYGLPVGPVTLADEVRFCGQRH